MKVKRSKKHKYWRKKSLQYYYKHKAFCNAQSNKRNKTARRKNPATFLIYSCRNRAKNKKLAFNLLATQLVIPKICPILRIPIQVCGKNIENHPTVDRLDNQKGYTIDNIHIVSRKANTMKSNASSKELIAFANWVLRSCVSSH